MPDTLTLAQLNALPLAEQDRKLRQLCTVVLEPGPWEHDWGTHGCERCSLQYEDTYKRGSPACPIPPLAEGSWADLAERLRDKVPWPHVDPYPIAMAVSKFQHDPMSAMYWWACEAEARERVICLLIALGVIRL